jgi:hypothetical protein
VRKRGDPRAVTAALDSIPDRGELRGSTRGSPRANAGPSLPWNLQQKFLNIEVESDDRQDLKWRKAERDPEKTCTTVAREVLRDGFSEKGAAIHVSVLDEAGEEMDGLRHLSVLEPAG